MLKNKILSLGAIVGLSLLSTTALAAGGNVESMITNVSNLGNSMVDAIATFAKVGGIGLFVWGLWDWYQTGQQGSQVKMKTVVIKLLVGALLVAAPFVLDSTVNQVSGGGAERVKGKAQNTADSWD